MEGPPGFESITLSGYAEVRGALTNNDLSRSLDRDRFEKGNLKEGTLSVLHGADHRERRRMENKLFRRDMFELYEHELFPDIVSHTLDSFVDPVESDLMEIGGLISVVLACRTAGIDFDWNSIEDRQRLRYFLHEFALGGAIDSAKGDPEVIKAQMRSVFGEFRTEFLTESRKNRAFTVKQRTAGERVELLYDILTTLLVNQSTSGMSTDLIERESTLFFSARRPHQHPDDDQHRPSCLRMVPPAPRGPGAGGGGRRLRSALRPRGAPGAPHQPGDPAPGAGGHRSGGAAGGQGGGVRAGHHLGQHRPAGVRRRRPPVQSQPRHTRRGATVWDELRSGNALLHRADPGGGTAAAAGSDACIESPLRAGAHRGAGGVRTGSGAASPKARRARHQDPPMDQVAQLSGAVQRRWLRKTPAFSK